MSQFKKIYFFVITNSDDRYYIITLRGTSLSLYVHQSNLRWHMNMAYLIAI